MKRTSFILNFLLLALATFFVGGTNVYSSEDKSLLKSHSIKTLNVTGEPMALIQLFVPGAHIKVFVDDEMVGLTQKENLLSLYVDLEDLNPKAKEKLEKLGQSRSSNEVMEILNFAFVVKEGKNSISLSLKEK